MKNMNIPLLACTLLLGCGGGDAAGVDPYFDAKPYTNAACNVADTRLATRREMRLFTHGNGDVSPYSQALQRYYRRHGLTFFSNQEIETIDQAYALDTDTTALNAALVKEFPGTNLDDPMLETSNPTLYESVVKSVLNFMFRPAVDFARSHSASGTAVTNLVLLPQISRPGGEDLLPAGAEIAGLAISPALLATFVAQNVPEGAAWKSIDLPATFTPMMFLDAKVLASVSTAAPDLVDLVVAHEFGHTGGLVHRQATHNLMAPGVTPGVNVCTDSLDDDQIQTMRTTFGLGGKTSPLLAKASALDDPARDLRALLPSAELAALRHGDRAALAKLIKHFAP